MATIIIDEIFIPAYLAVSLLSPTTVISKPFRMVNENIHQYNKHKGDDQPIWIPKSLGRMALSGKVATFGKLGIRETSRGHTADK